MPSLTSNLLFPEYIRTLKPYVPGKPIEETQREYRIKKVIKLASNENPLGASPKARLSLRRGLKELHRYPDASGYKLKAAISLKERVKLDEIVLGNGSNEIIESLVRVFCLPGDAIVASKTAFIAYRISAQIHGVRTLEPETRADLRFDLDAILAAVKNDDKCRLVFLPNCNNPTGSYINDRELRAFLQEVQKVRGGSVLVVLDSAYAEYVTASDLPDPIKIWRDYPNTVVVLKTFSKVYGLAALRVGYGIAAPEVISILDKIRMPFHLNSLGLLAAESALEDRGFVAQAVRLNTAQMKYWEKQLKTHNIPFWPSQGNFILVNARKGFGLSGPELYENCLRRGVILRPVANYGLPDCIRISIGSAEENRRAFQVLKEWVVT